MKLTYNAQLFLSPPRTASFFVNLRAREDANPPQNTESEREDDGVISPSLGNLEIKNEAQFCPQI